MSISTSLPPSSGIKMIEALMLFCLLLTLIDIFLQAYVNLHVIIMFIKYKTINFFLKFMLKGIKCTEIMAFFIWSS